VSIPVLLMARSLGPGGSERQMAAAALSLNRGRFLPHVACVEGGFHLDAIEHAGIPVLKLPLTSFQNRSCALSILRLIRFIRSRRIRLVHPYDHTLTLLGIPVAAGCPGVVALSSQRGYFDVIPTNHLRLLHLAHRLANGIVVNCEAVRRQMVERHGYRKGKIAVCYNGLDTAHFSPGARRRLEQLEGARLVVGLVCVLRLEKNVAMLLEAFARVKQSRQGLRLLIAGSGPEEQNLKTRARQLGIAADTLFVPSTADVARMLYSIDVFVHPSRSEALPNSVMEAMGCGCAVIASDVGGCAEIIQPDDNGWLFPNGDAAALTRLLAQAVDDTALRQRAAARGSLSIRERFSIPASVRRLEEIYGSFLKDVKSS